MIGILKGTIESVTDSQIVLMTQGGVGYILSVPQPGLLDTGDTITLHTYLAVRETALDLYGFTNLADKDFFGLLLSVPKIGPKSALQVLTQTDIQLLSDCIRTEDPSRLHKLSGVGKKTCENIVTNLKGKIDSLPTTETGAITGSLNALQTDAIEALVSLGFEPKAARDHVVEATKNNKDLNVSDLVASALK